MYRWLVRKLTQFALGRLRRGDHRVLLAMTADDVHFRSLGENSWAADYHAKQAVRHWLDRYRRARLELRAHDIVVGHRGTR